MIVRTFSARSGQLMLALMFSLPLTASGKACAQPNQNAPGKPLEYLRKHVGQEPYDLWKSQPLQKRLTALLGLEYRSLIANMNPASELMKSNGILHTEGNAPHEGGVEEAILLVDVDNDTIEVFLRHKETIVRAWAEHDRTVVIPHDAMERMRGWPRSALAQALANLQRNASASSTRDTARSAAQTSSGTTQSAAPTICQAGAACYESNSFSATINDFRTSAAGRFKIITANLRITNKLNRGLTLGVEQGSGLAIDDQGNRYVIDSPNSIRGLGVITSSSAVDTKFTLAPGESGDARVEMLLAMEHNIVYGTSFQISMTLREIDRVGASQLRLGREHEVRFAQLTNGLAPRPNSLMGGASRTEAAQPPVAPYNATQSAPVTASPDACGATPRCYSSGPVVATIAQVSASSVGNFKDHVLRVDVKFRNLSSQPIILAYASGTSTALDNLGNSYSWGHTGSHDLSAQGIGLTTRSSADPQFILQPGETRSATFQVIRYRPGNSALGTLFTYAVTIDQLEILPSQQIRTTREFSMNFLELRTSAFPAQGVGDSLRKLGDIFTKKRSGPQTGGH